MKKRILDLGMLYVGKFGALGVGFFLMPMYSIILGPTQFSTVAFVLSLVNAAVTLDFGMSTIVGRDSSDFSIKRDYSYKQFLSSLAVVIIFYITLFFLFILYYLFFRTHSYSIKIEFFSLILILSSLIQNISVSYLNGMREFKVSGGVLFLSVVFRGVGSLLAIKYINDTVSVFMLVQATIAIVFSILFVLLPTFLNSTECPWRVIFQPSEYLQLILPLAKKGLPLLFMGVSATLVMQLDKIVIARFSDPATLSAYYLAFTFSTIPILAVAGPIKQYFQPNIISELTKNSIAYRKHSIIFFWCLILFVAVPSALGYPFLKQIISIWLGNNILVDKVFLFSLVLIPAFAIGAISYYPTVLLVVAEDYKFQSSFAILTSVLFAISLFFVAFVNFINLIPWLFISYFVIVILVCGLRCAFLNKINLCIYDSIKSTPFAVGLVVFSYAVGYVLSLLA